MIDPNNRLVCDHCGELIHEVAWNIFEGSPGRGQNTGTPMVVFDPQVNDNPTGWNLHPDCAAEFLFGELGDTRFCAGCESKLNDE